MGELELGRVACQACAGPREREREKTLMGVGGGWMACGGAAVALLSCQKVVWPVAASVAYPPHPCGWPVVVVPRWPAVVMACPPARLPAWPHHLRATLLSARHYGTPPPPPPVGRAQWWWPCALQLPTAVVWPLQPSLHPPPHGQRPRTRARKVGSLMPHWETRRRHWKLYPAPGATCLSGLPLFSIQPGLLLVTPAPLRRHRHPPTGAMRCACLPAKVPRRRHVARFSRHTAGHAVGCPSPSAVRCARGVRCGAVRWARPGRAKRHQSSCLSGAAHRGPKAKCRRRPGQGQRFGSAAAGAAATTSYRTSINCQ